MSCADGPRRRGRVVDATGSTQPDPADRSLPRAQVLALIWAPVVIPIRSILIHHALKRVLKSAPKSKLSPMSFNGRPKDGALDATRLRPFFADRAEDGAPRPNPDALDAECRDTAKDVYTEGVTSPWQFDSDAGAFRAGLSRRQSLLLANDLYRKAASKSLLSTRLG